MRPIFRVAGIAGLSLSTLVTAHSADICASQAESGSYRVLVTGEVRYPGRATLTSATMTVLDALSAVGSPTSSAGDEVIVIHAAEPGATPQARTLSLKDMELGRPGLDIALQDGDIVNVPEAKRFYVVGFVKRPGAYHLRPGTTVSQALVQVGGLADGAHEGRIKIRRIVKGKAVELPARPEDKVLPDDEIKVPRRMF